MKVKEKINSINLDGYEAVAQLKNDVVILQPHGLSFDKILVFQVKDINNAYRIIDSHSSLNAIPSNWGEKRTWANKNKFTQEVSKSLRYRGSRIYVYDGKSILKYAQVRQPAYRLQDLRQILNQNLDLDFHNQYKEPQKDIIILDADAWKVGVDPVLVYKYIKFKSPASKKTFSVLFQPSNYLKDASGLWKLISILGEKQFEKELKQNHSLINSAFILDAFEHSGIHFYLSEEKKKIFASLSERVVAKYGKLPKIALNKVLNLIDVNSIETLLEEGQISY